MRTPFILFFLPILALAGNRLFAQSNPVINNISGTIWEIPKGDTTGVPIPGASVFLLHSRDSSLIKSTLSGLDGRFLFPEVNQGNYLLLTSFMGFAESYASIPLERFRRNGTIDLGKITLQESAYTIGELIVTGIAPEVVVKEDTLIYNTSAFRMEDGAVVEDLLKRLPGIEVEPDGTIKDATGRTIRRVFVNGREFFGNDPRMATRNLTVDMIDNVQVIEKKSDEAILTGVDDGETETIINLTIKKNRMDGWIGNISVGGGMLVNDRFDEGLRYSGRNTLNKFTEKAQTSFIVNANNINEGGGGSGGIVNSNSFGINNATTVSDKLKMNAGVRYSYTESSAMRNSFRTNILIDSVSYRRSESNNQNYTHNMEVNYRMEYKPASATTIVFEPRVSYNMLNANNNSFNETLAGDLDSSRVNRSNTLEARKTDGLTLNGVLTVSHRFEKAGRRLSVSMNGNLNHSKGDATNISQTAFFLQPDRNRDLNQEQSTSNNSNSFSFRVSYVEPLRPNLSLQASYNYRRNGTRNIRETFDLDDHGLYSSLNADYSKSLHNYFTNQNIGVSLNGRSKNNNYNYNVGVNIIPSFTQSTSFIKDGGVEGRDSILNRVEGRRVVNYAPQVEMTYRFNRQTNLRFTYRGNTRQPSVTQLDPTPDNTNPLNIRSGNPDLLPSFTHTMSLRFNANQREKQRNLQVSLDYSFTANEIINYTEYESGTGVQYTAPINENGSWNSSGNIVYSMPIGASKRFKFNTTTRISYNNRIGYSNVQRQSLRNVQGTFGVRENIGISYAKDWFYGQLRANANYTHTVNSLEGRQDQRNANYGITYNTLLTLPKSFSINSDINYRVTRGLSTGYNKDELIWNFGFSKKILKNNAGTLGLQWTDILQQRLNISRNITANYIEDSEYRALTSYVMASFLYRFNNYRGNNSNSRGRQGGGF